MTRKRKICIFQRRAYNLKKRGCTDPFCHKIYIKNLWEHQRGICALSGLPMNLKQLENFQLAAHLDHCHKTGLLRGFVCAVANMQYLVGLENLEEQTILSFAPNHVREYLINPPAQAFFKGLNLKDSAA
jgi:hypothetical protein